jgi:hypothetical protein
MKAVTEAKGYGELAQHGVLPSSAGGEWPGRFDLYCDGRSTPPAMTDRTYLPLLGLLSCERLTIQAAAAAGLLH